VGAATTKSFRARLVVIVLVAVVARLVYDLVVVRHVVLGVDSVWYLLEGGIIKDHHAYLDPAVFVVDRQPTAAWPPLFPSYLALTRVVGGDSIRAAQLAGLVTGAATVALTGLVARRVAGPRVGLLAAALAAVSPLLIAADGSVMSETLFVPLALSTLLAALYAMRSSRPLAWIAPGVCAGLAALTRAEGLLLVPFVVFPVVYRAARTHRWSWSSALLSGGVALTTLVAVLVPWVVRNAIRVDDPTIATLSSGTAIAGANCAQTYGGDALGSWDFACIRSERRTDEDEAEWASTIRRGGVRYARDHASRLPIVGAARIARLWSFWNVRDQVDRERLESRNRAWQYAVAVTGILTLVLGVAGLVRLGRARRPIEGLVGLVAMVTVVALVTYGNTRFRTSAEPALLVGVAAILSIRRQRPATVTSRRSETSSCATAFFPPGNA
jgi:4-amino-4-deoxy-L-arabinose transferase-like glycosyltransferase